MKLSILAITMGLVLVGAVGWQVSMAQEADYILAHEDVFGDLRRPQVSFSHETHAESLEKNGCGVCHHTPTIIPVSSFTAREKRPAARNAMIYRKKPASQP